MLESMISTMNSKYMTFQGSNIVPQRMGASFATVVPYRVFQTKDRAVAMLVVDFGEGVEHPAESDPSDGPGHHPSCRGSAPGYRHSGKVARIAR